MIFTFYFQTFHYFFLICNQTPANPSATFTVLHWNVEHWISIEIMGINAARCSGESHRKAILVLSCSFF